MLFDFQRAGFDVGVNLSLSAVLERAELVDGDEAVLKALGKSNGRHGSQLRHVTFFLPIAPSRRRTRENVHELWVCKYSVGEES